MSESADQHVHIRETPGFNIGAAGTAAAHCRNSLHVHRSAEVFLRPQGALALLLGAGRAPPGSWCSKKATSSISRRGSSRGFENIGADYGLLMSILGGTTTPAAGVIWAPQVIEEAKTHGLVLAETGRLYDTRKGERLPEGTGPMPRLDEQELERFAEPTVEALVPAFVGRYEDMVALSSRRPARVIGGEGALIRDRPGFEVDFLSRASLPPEPYRADRHEVLMVPPRPLAPHLGRQRDGARPPATPAWCSPVSPAAWSPRCRESPPCSRVRGTDDPAGPTPGFDPSPPRFSRREDAP